MLPKKHRIPRKDFNLFLKNSIYFHSEHFLLRVSREKINDFRAAVSVSKKISKKATDRNTIRRRVYGVLEKHLKSFRVGTAIFISKPKAQHTKGRILEEEILNLMKSAKFIS